MRNLGYSFLSSQEQKLYDYYEKAFKSYSAAVDANGIGRNVDETKVMDVVLSDNPEVIYFDKTRLSIATIPFKGKKILFSNVMPLKKAKLMQTELDDALSKAIDEIMLYGPINDYSKLMAIYEYLQDNVEYDMDELNYLAQTGTSRNQFAHNAYGALVNKKAVCDGISSAFCLIAHTMGYECTLIKGKSNVETTNFSDHAWNIIKVGNNYYHLDATWDINQKKQLGEYSYMYFCVDDDCIKNDHEWDWSSVPRCTHDDISFYVRGRCVAENEEQLLQIFTRFAKSKQNTVRVKISKNFSVNGDMQEYLGDKLICAASSMGRYSPITYIWNKNVRCFFAKFES